MADTDGNSPRRISQMNSLKLLFKAENTIRQPRALALLLGIVLAKSQGISSTAPASFSDTADSQNLPLASTRNYLSFQSSNSSHVWVQILALIDQDRWSEVCQLAERNLQNFQFSQKSQLIALAISAAKTCSGRKPHEWAQIHSDPHSLPPEALWKSLESSYESKAWKLSLKLAGALQKNSLSSSTQKDLAKYHRAWILWNQHHQNLALQELFDLQAQAEEALIKTQALKDFAVLSYRSQKLSNLRTISSSQLEVWRAVAQEYLALSARPTKKAPLAAVPSAARSPIAQALWSLPSAGAAEACHLLQITEHLTEAGFVAIRENFESKARTCWGYPRSNPTPSGVTLSGGNKKDLPENFVSVLKLHQRLGPMKLRGWERHFILVQAEAEKMHLAANPRSTRTSLDRLICTEIFQLLLFELTHAERPDSWPYLWDRLQACPLELQSLAHSLPSLKILGSIVDSWMAQTHSGTALMEIFTDLKFENFPQSQKKIFQDLFDQKIKMSPEMEQKFLQTTEILPELQSQVGLLHFSRGNFAALSGPLSESLRQSFNRKPELWKSQWKLLWPHRKYLKWPELQQMSAQLESGKLPETQLLAKFGLDRLNEWQKLVDSQAHQITRPMNLTRFEDAVNRLQKAKSLQVRLFAGLPEELVALSRENLARMRAELAAALERTPADKMGLSAQEIEILIAQLKQGFGS
ncbi:MAG: hypothetical protein WCH11_00905 [Bdellovibrio sp.]